MYKICLIMGSGNLPFEILKKYKKEEILIICLKEASINLNLLQGYNYFICQITKVGKMLKIIKKNSISDVIFAGGLKKPNFYSLIPDITGFFLLYKILKLKQKGDDAVLKEVINFVNKKGINVKSMAEVCKDVIVQQTTYTKNTGSLYEEDITFAKSLLTSLSKYDVGQGVVLQNGVVLGIEAIEGTDALIKRTSDLKYNIKRLPILVKMPKINQTLKADMPSIGLNTIRNLHECGFAGIAIASGGSIFVEQEEAILYANKNNLFIIGF